MISRRSFMAGSSALGVASTAWAKHGTPALQTAYVNAVVWTGSDTRPKRGSIGVANGRIVAVGEERVRSLIGPSTEVIDLQGAFVMPGMTDCHTHFSLASLGLAQLDLRGARTPAALTAMIAERAKATKGGRWVLGTGWDADQWGGQLPDKTWIDAVTGDVPVAVTRYDLHMMLLNSAALRAAKIDRHTQDVAGGVIVRDKTGEPTGLVKDGATAIVNRAIPSFTSEQIDSAMRKGIALGLSKGVTKVHTPELDWTTHESLLRLRATGETDMRFYSLVPLKDWERLASLVQERGRGDDWVGWGGLKVVADGSLGSRTAYFQQPYEDEPSTRGIHVNDPKNILEWGTEVDRHGFQLAVHAIGDQMTHDVLDIFEQIEKRNGPRDRRFRMEHAQHLQIADLPRFRQLGVIASIQPYHAVDDGRWAIHRVGAKRLQGSFAYRSLIDAGAHVCCGSDWPVAPLDPLTGVQAAILRQTLDGRNPGGWLPEQKLTLLQTLHGYTTEAAYAGFAEDRMGVIAPGYLADFVVFDHNLFEIDTGKMTTASVLRTVVDGRSRFER